MKKRREGILADTLLLLGRLADDWEYSNEITQDTCLFTDMGFESLDVVVLAAATQEHYRQLLPFPEFFAEVGERDQQDISVGDWVDFIYTHLNDGPSQGREA